MQGETYVGVLESPLRWESNNLEFDKFFKSRLFALIGMIVTPRRTSGTYFRDARLLNCLNQFHADVKHTIPTVSQLISNETMLGFVHT